MARRAMVKRKELIANGGAPLTGEEDLTRLLRPKNSNKKHSSVMLTNTMSKHGFSEEVFECLGASNGKLHIDDVWDALNDLLTQDNVNATSRNLFELGENSLKIILGISLV